MEVLHAHGDRPDVLAGAAALAAALASVFKTHTAAYWVELLAASRSYAARELTCVRLNRIADLRAANTRTVTTTASLSSRQRVAAATPCESLAVSLRPHSIFTVGPPVRAALI